MSALYQSTRGKLKPIVAFLSIFLSVMSLFLADGALVWLNNRGAISSTVANICIAALALILFVILLWRYSISCVYILDGVKISFNRVYLKNPRLEETVMLREVIFFGSPEESDSKYSPSRTRRFVAGRGSIETKALVYKRNNRTLRILFSPNEEISAALSEALKSK